MDKTGFSPEGTILGSPEVSSGSGSINAHEPTNKNYFPVDTNTGMKLPRQKLSAPAAPITARKLPQSYKLDKEVKMFTIDSDDGKDAEAIDVDRVDVISDVSEERLAEIQLIAKRRRAERADTMKRKKDELDREIKENEEKDAQELKEIVLQIARTKSLSSNASVKSRSSKHYDACHASDGRGDVEERPNPFDRVTKLNKLL